MMTWGTLTFMGSGELAPAMGKVYRRIFKEIAGPVRGIFLDTPAGFELNADAITAKVLDYFHKRLAVELGVPSLRRVTPEAAADASAALERANFMFTGPGSPTYAVRMWREAGMAEVLARRLQAGTHMVFASAAAIAASCCALPVYEIYKVGQDPYWNDGLDLLGPFGLHVAVVPHWNNAEGGTHDTEYCYMGAARFAELERDLPEGVVILGVDEYTAVTLDLARREATVLGAGNATVRYRAREQQHASGTTFSLDELTAGGAPLGVPARVDSAPAEDGAGPAPAAEEPAAAGAAEFNALVDLLVALRGRLRAEKQYKLADEVRDGLSKLGIEIKDTPEGTQWSARL
jgi:peptidase E